MWNQYLLIGGCGSAGEGPGSRSSEAWRFQRADGSTGSRRCSARDVFSGPDTTSSRQDSAVSCCLPCTPTHLDSENTHAHAHLFNDTVVHWMLVKDEFRILLKSHLKHICSLFDDFFSFQCLLSEGQKAN